MKDAVLWKNDAHKAICCNSTEESKRKYKGINNKAKKAFSKAIGEKAVEKLTELKDCLD